MISRLTEGQFEKLFPSLPSFTTKKAVKIPRSASKGEETFYRQLYDLNPSREYRFTHDRKWKFDFAFPEYMVAVECEGGAYTNGRHTRGSGFIADMEKYNRAAIIGWTVLRYTPEMIKNGTANVQVRLVLANRKGAIAARKYE